MYATTNMKTGSSKSSNTEIAKSVKRITEMMSRGDVKPHPIPLPSNMATLPHKIIQKMIEAILMNGYEVTGSALTKKTPPDIDVYVPGLRFNFVEVHKKIMESISLIDYGACRIQSTIEKTNVLYGEKIKCRYIVVITIHQENGVEKEIMIDLTDGVFDPPVYITNTVKAERMGVVFSKQPSGNNWKFNKEMMKFNFAALSTQAYKNTFTTVLVPNYNSTRPITTLERVMKLRRADRSEVNPQSVLFGNDIVSSLDAIRRINDTNKKKKFLGGVEYNKTVKITISKKNLCDPDWCSCNQGEGYNYQHGITERTFVTLQCCGTTVCADLLTNRLKAKYKAQFCPFSGPEGPHFMQFMDDSLLEPRHKSLMSRLNRYWWYIGRENEILEKRAGEKKLSYQKVLSRESRNIPPLYDHFEDDSSEGEMPELDWGEEDKDPSQMRPNKYNQEDKKQIEEKTNTMPVPLSMTDTRVMEPHCNTPGCKQCLHKMDCFQTWASSLVVVPNVPMHKFAMLLPAHMSLNL